MSENVRAIVAELRRRLEQLYDERLERMIIFGSQARGDAESDSDIDVLVVLRGEVNPFREIERTSETVCDLSLECARDIATAFVSVERFEKEHSPFLLNVRREGIAL